MDEDMSAHLLELEQIGDEIARLLGVEPWTVGVQIMYSIGDDNTSLWIMVGQRAAEIRPFSTHDLLMNIDEFSERRLAPIIAMGTL
ncbi:hypothetical protein [Paraburkholderia sp. HD33-4]|uniref:hypothetical protein n=1 Tax=Paraburkholderia sp. HD33-4 TaxID=2883242 RepID=UPI001F214B40|nr:hypothetical protein [Paraburkholderia sp. HD33-4]